MTTQESKSIGGKQILKAAFLLFVLFELCLLYNQTNGDFANGILFFLSIQTNGLFVMFIISYFACMIFTGRQVGALIFKRNKTSHSVAILSSFITTFLTIGLFFMFVDSYKQSKNFSNLEIILDLLMRFFVLLIPMTIVWLWALSRIKHRMNIK